MYTHFFELGETPFSIAPNPKFLYMTRRHKEALAHLTYGLQGTSGFVLLTGEVGTGKTTLSRALLQSLPEQTETAFILNPALTAPELLASICDELGIDYQRRPLSMKDLFDALTERLLENHKNGISTVLLIDEAQHLAAEVMEQLRLLTNLETDHDKLLRVILIGQPELQQMLKLPHLRQLAQRITSRYHLLPLEKGEVAAFLDHRIRVAGGSRSLFQPVAINLVHRYSRGIPRLVNLLADRALLAAYAESSPIVRRRDVQFAAQEVLGDQMPAKTNLAKPAALVLTVGMIVAGMSQMLWQHEQAVPVEVVQAPQTVISESVVTSPEPTAKAESNPVVEPEAKPESEQASIPVVNTPRVNPEQRVLEAAGDARTPAIAMSDLMSVWGYSVSNSEASCPGVARAGFQCREGQGGLFELIEQDYPAVVELIDETGMNYFATLYGVKGDEVNLLIGGQGFAVSQQWFSRHWQGHFTQIWLPPTGFQYTLRKQHTGPLVQWLDDALSSQLGAERRYTEVYDQTLVNKVKAFQQSESLGVDGSAGPQTMMRLQLRYRSDVPRLSGNKEG